MHFTDSRGPEQLRIPGAGAPLAPNSVSSGAPQRPLASVLDRTHSNRVTEGGTSPEEGGRAELANGHLVRAMRGFSYIFWGLPLTLLLYFKAVDIHVVNRFRLPTYIVGMVVIYFGLVQLLHCGIGSRQWRRTARHGLIASFLLIYLGPFVYWFQYLPRVGTYYTVNSAALLAGIIWLLYTINRLAEELGAATVDSTLRFESRLFAWSVVLMMFVPLLIAAAVSSYMAMKYQSSLLTEMQTVQRETPVWVYILFLLPLSLTMMSAWRGKEHCIRALHENRGEAAVGA
jgi:hypothetical protein